ncbi:hypothetical protein BD410DRAFT_515703 [Rickenella mellea]|uniref:Uncharacterized protein n=1 Tax=Rickenella mellea TaxID=50990 RepID=A0A4Y7PR50_9AGAM|nr:hypothetical protein BD410DRAFT_515703 [Rickenella mellea]
MQEAQARGCFSPSTPLNMLQATLHDLILDSTDVITSIQYLDGFELREHTDGPSWDTAKADLCRRFLSSFTPNGLQSLIDFFTFEGADR